jgi:hypothetical protein
VRAQVAPAPGVRMLAAALRVVGTRAEARVLVPVPDMVELEDRAPAAAVVRAEREARAREEAVVRPGRVRRPLRKLGMRAHDRLPAAVATLPRIARGATIRESTAARKPRARWTEHGTSPSLPRSAVRTLHFRAIAPIPAPRMDRSARRRTAPATTPTERRAFVAPATTEDTYQIQPACRTCHLSGGAARDRWAVLQSFPTLALRAQHQARRAGSSAIAAPQWIVRTANGSGMVDSVPSVRHPIRRSRRQAANAESPICASVIWSTPSITTQSSQSRCSQREARP